MTLHRAKRGEFMGLITFPILQTARKSGLAVTDSGAQVHINCPFCGDSKQRLYLYPNTEQYHCFHCGAHGNAVSLYARRTGLSYANAYHELAADEMLHFPLPAVQKPPEREPAGIEQRDAVYRALLDLLPLSVEHHQNLSGRGLPDQAIAANGYRSLQDGKELRDTIAAQLSSRYDLNNVPGFYFRDGSWRFCAYSGLLIPIRDTSGRIQGIQIRRENVNRMKYVWLSSAGKPYGTGARSWIHVTGNCAQNTAVITEGPLKGDIASMLSDNALFICIPGVSAIKYLPDTLKGLHLTSVHEAFDMDKLRNPQVAAARKRLRQVVADCGIRCQTLLWNETYNGIDDYLAAKRIS